MADAPSAPFPGTTGRGVSVAIIDSGVNPSHSHIGRIAGGAMLLLDDEPDLSEAAWLDRLGHGTAVTAAIQEKAPGAEILAVKVFHTALRSSAATLLRAIDWCLEQEVDVINLSLGATNPAHAETFAAAAARAAAAGAILVAAREANGVACYPGSLPGVLGVGLDWDCPREGYRCVVDHGRRRFEASGYPRPVPGVAPVRNLYGISFAVANMTGIVARALEAVPAASRAPGRLAVVEAALAREALAPA